MCDELKTIWKKVAETKRGTIPEFCLECLRENTIDLNQAAGATAETQTDHFPVSHSIRCNV
jgi:hypothetical protein